MNNETDIKEYTNNERINIIVSLISIANPYYMDAITNKNPKVLEGWKKWAAENYYQIAFDLKNVIVPASIIALGLTVIVTAPVKSEIIYKNP